MDGGKAGKEGVEGKKGKKMGYMLNVKEGRAREEEGMGGGGRWGWNKKCEKKRK